MGARGSARRWTAWTVALTLGTAGALAWPALCAPSAVGGGPLSTSQLGSLGLGAYPRQTAPPEFTLTTAEGQTVSLAELRGKVVLLNFWASWCLECRPEMPALETLHRRFGARGLVVVGVNTRESATTVRAYARELGLTFSLVLDVDGTVTHRYGVIGLPTTFLIGRDGRAVGLAVGGRAWASTAAMEIIETLLAATAEGGEPGK